MFSYRSYMLSGTHKPRVGSGRYRVSIHAEGCSLATPRSRFDSTGKK
jgi:hypothetical protein